jgi:exopolysaccharide production protein ExoY
LASDRIATVPQTQVRGTLVGKPQKMSSFPGAGVGPFVLGAKIGASMARAELVLPPVAAPPVSNGTAVLSAGRGRSPRVQPVGGVAKRIVDIVLATAVLVVAAPVMLMVAALIRICMGGPVIFGQQRLGFNGRVFTCYKFRSMAVDAGELLRRHLAADPSAAREWAETQKLRNDPRIGRLGQVLRKSSLDELPQLFNVLRGDMSLIGPRPIVIDEIWRYGRNAHAYFSARPGLTGMWQTSGRNRVSYAARVARDRYYVRRWSLRLDLVLLIKTVPTVLNFDLTA